MIPRKVASRDMQDDLRPEYDFAKVKEAVRGKYCRRLQREGSNIVLLDPDVAKVFHDPEAVNQTLRPLLKVAGYIQPPWSCSRRLVRTCAAG